MGRRHVRVLAEMPDRYELRGVFDANRLVAEQVAAERKVAAYEDVPSCVSDVELVVIASPIEAHAAGARCALDLGRHAFVEKPLCSNVGDAFAVVGAAARGSARLFVGHSERFNPVIVALQRLVPAADVRAISIRRATGSSPGTLPEHDVLLSLGVHDVDLAFYLTGAPVFLREVSRALGSDEVDRAELTLRAKNGALVRIAVDRTAPRRERTIELRTRREVFEGDLLTPCLYRRPRGGGPRTVVDVTNVEPLVAQARAISETLDGARSTGSSGSVASGADGARALALVVEARRRIQADWVAEPRVSEAS
jgi:predicted dehydrogenase